MHKIKIHSIVDVITNSSTVIYTYQNSSSEATALLQEILTLLGETRKVDELFYINEFLSKIYYYSKYLDELEDVPEGYPNNSDGKKRDDWVSDRINDVLIGKISKPKWMIEAEDHENPSGFCRDLDLCILAREEKYKELAYKMIKFLNSPDADGGYNG